MRPRRPLDRRAVRAGRVDDGAGGLQWTAVALRVARSAPRLLVAGGGWTIARADGWAPARGEPAFTRGSAELELSWHAARRQGRPAARAHVRQARARRLRDRPRRRPRRIYKYRGQDLFVAGWRDGKSWLIARAPGPEAADFAALLGRLHAVDVDTWLGAMPASVVRPADNGSAVAEMLQGVPVPDGLDVAAAVDTGGPRDRYQLGAAVSGTVACAWIDRLRAARTASDAAAERQATAALKTARGWPVLRAMEADGQYPQVLWQTVDSFVDPAALPQGMAQKTAAAPDAYRDALGCQAP